MAIELLLKDLHIGKILKEIAVEKGVSSKEIAGIINYNPFNADKIFKMNDMNIEDIVRISFLLKDNILDLISKKYLPHLSLPDNYVIDTSRLMQIDVETKQIIIYDPYNNCNFLEETHIGQHIREVAEYKKYKLKEMASKLQCAQSMVSYIYKKKSIKVKMLIKISLLLQYNFIAATYLSQMTTVFSMNMVNGCTIRLDPLQVSLNHANNKTFSMVFQQNGAKKEKGYCIKIDENRNIIDKDYRYG